jgi:hypothetical protein
VRLVTALRSQRLQQLTCIDGWFSVFVSCYEVQGFGPRSAVRIDAVATLCTLMAEPPFTRI